VLDWAWPLLYSIAPEQEGKLRLESLWRGTTVEQLINRALLPIDYDTYAFAWMEQTTS
jgi:hypothetical protein